MDGVRTAEGGEGVTGAMIRARIWVDGRLAGGHRKARVDGPAQRIRNFAEVVSTALFAKLSGGRPGQPAQLVVAIHCR